MATATFATRKDVVGFDRCNGIVDEHRGFQLRRQDVTGGHSFGYDHALCVEIRDLPLTDEQYLADDFDALRKQHFATGVTLSFTQEQNKLGAFGCFSPGWFRDADVEKARRAFRCAVDNYLAAR